MSPQFNFGAAGAERRKLCVKMKREFGAEGFKRLQRARRDIGFSARVLTSSVSGLEASYEANLALFDRGAESGGDCSRGGSRNIAEFGGPVRRVGRPR